MRTRKYLGASILAVALVVAAGAPAMAKNSYTLNVPFDAAVKGTHLAAGQYKVQWETRSPGANVTFQKGHEIVATVEGNLVDRGQKYPSNAVVYDTAADGSRSIVELRFRGSSQVVVFSE